MTTFGAERRPRRGQDGLSLVSVLVASALTILVLVTFGQVFTFSRGMMTIVRSAKSYREVGTSYEAWLWRRVQAYVTATSCANPEVFSNYINDASANSIGTYGEVAWFGGGIRPEPGLPAFRNNAARRCRTPRIHSDAERSEFYFCVDLRRPHGTTAPLDSFWNGYDVFSEVYIRLIDLNTNGKVACNAFNGTPTAGAVGFYSVYWAKQAAGVGSKFLFHHGTFYGAK